MTVKHTPYFSNAGRSASTVYFSRSLTRTALTVVALAIALLLIILLG